MVLAVTVGDKNISEFCEMSIREELAFIAARAHPLRRNRAQIGGQILKEIKNRLQFCRASAWITPLHGPGSGYPSGGEPAYPPDDLGSAAPRPACCMCWMNPRSVYPAG